MNKVIFDDNIDNFPATMDRTAGGRYSVVGPTEDTREYIAWDHEDAVELDRGRDRQVLIELIKNAPDDRLS